VYRATGIVYPNWVCVATLPLTTTSLLTSLPVPNVPYYYRIDAVDGFQPLTDTSMIVDTLGNVYALDQDQITRLEIPAAFTSVLAAAGNSSGKPLVLRTEENPADLTGRTLKSVTFATMQSPSNAAAPLVSLPAANAQVVLAYDTVAGNVVPSLGGQPFSAAHLVAASAPETVPASEAPQSLGMYWDQGQNYIKLYGKVDSVGQTVSVNAAYAGTYQIRSVARTAGANFDLSGLTNKAITPNNPNGLNSKVTFIYDNPQDSAVSGKIFDIRGTAVSDMTAGPVMSGSSGSLQWDGRSNGRVVPGGIYIYQIQAEGKTWTGTVVVIR
jgi:hypothetical protein